MLRLCVCALLYLSSMCAPWHHVGVVVVVDEKCRLRAAPVSTSGGAPRPGGGSLGAIALGLSLGTGTLAFGWLNEDVRQTVLTSYASEAAAADATADVAPDAPAVATLDMPAHESSAAPASASPEAPAAPVSAEPEASAPVVDGVPVPAESVALDSVPVSTAGAATLSPSTGRRGHFNAELEALLRTPDDALSLEDRLRKKEEEVRRSHEQLLALQAVIEQQALAQEERIRERVSDAIQHKEAVDSKAFDEVVRLQEQKHKLELDEQRQRLAADHERSLALKDELAAELRAERDRIASEKIAQQNKLEQLSAVWETELAEQRLLLERSFGREKEDRLRRIGEIEHKLANVESAAEALANHRRYSAFVHELSNVTLSLARVYSTSAPFEAELVAVRRVALSHGVEAILAVAKSMPAHVSANGVPSQKYLYARFADVRKRIRRVALVQLNGSISAHLVSAVYAACTFAKEGLVAGNDVDAILARAHYWLVKEDLARAVAEMETLPRHEWSARLAASWIQAAKDRLAAEQAMLVIQSEVAALTSALTA